MAPGRLLHVQLAVAASSTQLFAWFLFAMARRSPSMWRGNAMGLGVFGAYSFGVSVLYFWALRQRPSYHDSFTRFSLAFLFKGLVGLFQRMKIGSITASWKSPRKSQEELLREIIFKNGDTEYGRRYDLKSVQSLEDLRRKHPLTTYEHYRYYVERMMDGQENILTSLKPTSFVRTTGTTGKSKHIPYTDRMAILSTYSCVHDLMLFKENAPNLGYFQKKLYLYVHPKVEIAKSGAKIETMGTLPDVPAIFLADFLSPKTAYGIQSMYEAIYVHLLFGMREEDVGTVIASFMSILDIALRQLKEDWVDILYDLERGTLNAKLDLSHDVRKQLLKDLGKGYPERASALRREFVKGFDGILKRIWPSLHVINGIDNTGLWPKMESTVAKGVTFIPSGYGCSEGFFGTYLGPKFMKELGYLPFPTSAICEFIKEEDMHEDQPRTYFLDEVEVGESYEVVCTQAMSGMYRYRLGDVVKIVGVYDNCPYFKFMYRTGQMLNLIYEKMDQRIVEEAVQAAVARWDGAELREYSVAESRLLPDDFTGIADHGSVSPYYVFFIELYDHGTRSSSVLTAEEKGTIDEELRLRNSDFDRLRREGGISTPRVFLVAPGGFDTLRDFILATTNATAQQYKSPRKLRLLSMAETLLQSVTQ